MLLLPIVLAQAGCTMTAPAAGLRHEHYDPAYLNEEALAALAAGDRGTARILLERAAVLAPRNVVVRENLEVVRSGGALHVTRHLAPAVAAVQAVRTVQAGAMAASDAADAAASVPLTGSLTSKPQSAAASGIAIWPLK